MLQLVDTLLPSPVTLECTAGSQPTIHHSLPTHDQFTMPYYSLTIASLFTHDQFTMAYYSLTIASLLAAAYLNLRVTETEVSYSKTLRKWYNTLEILDKHRSRDSATQVYISLHLPAPPCTS